MYALIVCTVASSKEMDFQICVIGAWLCEVCGAWCHPSSSWSFVMTSCFEQRLGALCNFFAFYFLCFIPECSYVMKVICNLWLPSSSLSALLDKCSGCVLSTNMQTCCLCRLCKSGLSYHSFIWYLHPALKRGKYSEIPFERSPDFIPHPVSDLISQDVIAMCTFYIFCVEQRECIGVFNLEG